MKSGHSFRIALEFYGLAHRTAASTNYLPIADNSVYIEIIPATQPASASMQSAHLPKIKEEISGLPPGAADWIASIQANGSFEHFRHDPENQNSLSDDLFMDVYVDTYNTVWAGTLGKGLNRLDPATGRVTHYFHDPENPTSLPDDNIAVLIPDKKGGLWIGTFGGLSHYDPNTNTFTNYSHDPDNPSSLSENKVVSLYLDSKNILWIGTWGGGLNQLDLNDPLHTDPKTATLYQLPPQR